MTNREWLAKAKRLIPYATQTISKLPHQGTEARFPYFVREAKGAYFTDVEGRSFIDFFAACGPIILGHACKAVDDEVKRQIDRGFLFSTNSCLEVELAEKLTELFPHFGWAKFVKTGADALSAAVRIARAHTGKENVLHYGYHGWHDWYQAAVGGGRKNGIPQSTGLHARTFPYNDLEAVERELRADANVAAVVMTPYDWLNEPEAGYLPELRKLCTRYGVLLIFDEVKTGFRLGLTGAQGRFGVEPDLAAFAKAISNGYPLAVVMGRPETKRVMDDYTTLISTTYAGDALALTAALATIHELQTNEVFPHLEKMGNMLIAGMRQLASDHDLQLVVRGAPALLTFEFAAERLRDKQRFGIDWVNYHLQNGVFVKLQNGWPSYTLMHAHTETEIARALEVAGEFVSSSQCNLY